MPIYTFDTSVVIAYKIRELPNNFLLSAVVIAELTASAADDSSRKVFEAMRWDYEKFGALIVPEADDWLTASRVLYWLARGRKKTAGGKAPKLVLGATQRMFLDALLAVRRNCSDQQLRRLQSDSVLLSRKTSARLSIFR